MLNYPAWRFRGKECVVVLNENEAEKLDSDWEEKPPEGFVCPNVATYASVDLIPKSLDIDAIEKEVKERKKPGPKPKAE